MAKLKNVVKTGEKKPKTEKKNLAPQKLKILITVVNRNKADFYMDLIQSFESNMQCSVLAKGTAKRETLNLLGLEETDKTVILSLIKEEKVKDALACISEKFDTIKNGKGIAFTVPLSSTIGVLIYRFLSNNKSNMKEE